MTESRERPLLHRGSSYKGSEDPRLLVAAGDRAEVEVELRWPRGRRERFTLATGRHHLLTEGTGTSSG